MAADLAMPPSGAQALLKELFATRRRWPTRSSRGVLRRLIPAAADVLRQERQRRADGTALVQSRAQDSFTLNAAPSLPASHPVTMTSS